MKKFIILIIAVFILFPVISNAQLSITTLVPDSIGVDTTGIDTLTYTSPLRTCSIYVTGDMYCLIETSAGPFTLAPTRLVPGNSYKKFFIPAYGTLEFVDQVYYIKKIFLKAATNVGAAKKTVWIYGGS